MIVFPPEFVKLKHFPGYFWNVEKQTLYSIKSGTLRPLKKHNGWAPKNVAPGYRVSRNGQTRNIRLEYLKTITLPEHNETVDISKES